MAINLFPHRQRVCNLFSPSSDEQNQSILSLCAFLSSKIPSNFCRIGQQTYCLGDPFSEVERATMTWQSFCFESFDNILCLFLIQSPYFRYMTRRLSHVWIIVSLDIAPRNTSNPKQLSAKSRRSRHPDVLGNLTDRRIDDRSSPWILVPESFGGDYRLRCRIHRYCQKRTRKGQFNQKKRRKLLKWINL